MFSIKRAKNKTVKKYEYKVSELIPLANCYQYLSNVYYSEVVETLKDIANNNWLEDDDIIVLDDTSENQHAIEFLNEYITQGNNIPLYITLKYNCTLNSNTTCDIVCTMDNLYTFADNLKDFSYTNFLERAFNSGIVDNETLIKYIPAFMRGESFNYIQRIAENQYVLKSFILELPDNATSYTDGKVRFLTENIGDMKFEYVTTKTYLGCIKRKAHSVTEIDLNNLIYNSNYVHIGNTIVIPNSIFGFHRLLTEPVANQVLFDNIGLLHSIYVHMKNYNRLLSKHEMNAD